MDQPASDALFISWGEFHAGAFGRFAIVVLAVIVLIGWLGRSGHCRRKASNRLRSFGRTLYSSIAALIAAAASGWS
jgi:hypothetical protein